MGTFIVGSIVAALVLLALRSTVGSIKSGGCAGCSGSSCGGCAHRPQATDNTH